MAHKFFTEKQQIKDPLLLSASAALLVYSLFLLGREIVINNFSHPIVISLLGVAVLVFAFGMWIVFRVRLKVDVTKNGINYKMSPLHNKKKKIKWDEVDTCKVIETPKMAHMHSGNMKFWYEKKFTLSGRNGLALITKEGDRYFIGTRETTELKKSIRKALGKRNLT